jgi:hypothetical protein
MTRSADLSACRKKTPSVVRSSTDCGSRRREGGDVASVAITEA